MPPKKRRIKRNKPLTNNVNDALFPLLQSLFDFSDDIWRLILMEILDMKTLMGLPCVSHKMNQYTFVRDDWFDIVGVHAARERSVIFDLEIPKDWVGWREYALYKHDKNVQNYFGVPSFLKMPPIRVGFDSSVMLPSHYVRHSNWLLSILRPVLDQYALTRKLCKQRGHGSLHKLVCDLLEYRRVHQDAVETYCQSARCSVGKVGIKFDMEQMSECHNVVCQSTRNLSDVWNGSLPRFVSENSVAKLELCSTAIHCFVEEATKSRMIRPVRWM